MSVKNARKIHALRANRPKFPARRFGMLRIGLERVIFDDVHGVPCNVRITPSRERRCMEYQVVIGRDREAGVWFVRTTNIPGLALEDPSLDNLLVKLPDAIAWVMRENRVKNGPDVPFEVLLVEHERARIAS